MQLRLHGDNLDGLYEYIPKEMLPAEYGGEAGPLQDIINHWEKKIIEYRDYFLEEEKNFGTDERKRLGKPKNAESLFDVGSFRKLEVD